MDQLPFSAVPNMCILSFNTHYNNSGGPLYYYSHCTDGRVDTENSTDPLAPDHPVSKHRLRTHSGSQISAHKLSVTTFYSLQKEVTNKSTPTSDWFDCSISHFILTY